MDVDAEWPVQALFILGTYGDLLSSRNTYASRLP
jgi:hypothetical protein